MKNNLWQTLAIAIIAGLILFIGSNTDELSAQEPAVVITSPSEGELITGLVIINGTADFIDFKKYEVMLKVGDNLVWVATGYSPVINGYLARFDTRIFNNGIYQLIIRQVNNDSNYVDFIGPTITIDNQQGSPSPYPEIESSLLYPNQDWAIARVKNCSGDNLEFDFVGVTEGCSGDKVMIPYKEQNNNFCPSQDFMLKPCEYRGTAKGEGQPKGRNYSFVAQAGMIYNLEFPGGTNLFINETNGDARADTDTGQLPLGDPSRTQTIIQPEPTAVINPVPENNPVPNQEFTPPNSDIIVSPPAETQPPALPVSGRGDEPTNPYFVIAATILILLLIGGGVIAMRQRSYPIQ